MRSSTEGGQEAILAVDDDESVLRFVVGALAPEGVRVECAGSAEEALERLSARRYPVVLTDVGLPGMSGTELLARVKALAPETEVILFSGSATVEAAIDAIRGGARDFLEKGRLGPERIATSVRSALAIARLGRENAAQRRALEARVAELQALHALGAAACRAEGLLELLPQVADAIGGVLEVDAIGVASLADAATTVRLLPLAPLSPPAEADAARALADALGAAEASGALPPPSSVGPGSSAGALSPPAWEVDRSRERATPPPGAARVEALPGRRIVSLETSGGAPALVLGIFARSREALAGRPEALFAAIGDHLALLRERLRAERELVRRDLLSRQIAEENERLRDVAKLKGDFVATVSHELRSPLNSILGFASILLDEIDGPIAPPQRHDLERLQANAKGLLELIEELLDLARLERQAVHLALAVLDLPALADECIGIARSLVRGKPIAVRWSCDADVPRIRTDARLLRRVLINLLSNAVKFTAEGEIVLEAKRRSDGLALTVRDTGPGIRSEDQERIFERFVQLEPSQTRHAGGTGLGLAISRELVDRLSGTLEVASEVGRGSAFTVALPKEPVERELGKAAEAQVREALAGRR